VQGLSDAPVKAKRAICQKRAIDGIQGGIRRRISP
jgi:hypothetical protein